MRSLAPLSSCFLFLSVSLGAAFPLQTPAPKAAATAREGSGNADAHYRQGVELARAGRDDEALRELKRSIELDPKKFEAYKALDDLLSKKRDWPTIIDYWTRYLQQAPNDGRAYCERGGTYSYLPDQAKALGDADKACSLGDVECCQLAANYRRNHARALPPAQAKKPGWQDLLGPLAVLALLASVPILVIIWLVSYIRSRRRGAAAPAGVLQPKPVVAPAAWQLPSELSSPAPRQVRMKTRTVLSAASIPLVALAAFWILFHDSKPMRNLAAELTQHHLDTQGVVALLVVGIWLLYPSTFVWRAGSVLFNSRSLLQDGQAVRGVVTGVSRSRSGVRIDYQFSTEAGIVSKGKYRPLLDARPYRKLMSGQSVTVLYDLHNPETNLLYPLEAYEVAS